MPITTSALLSSPSSAPIIACSRSIPATPSGNRALDNRRPGVHHLDVVVVLGPVVPNEQQLVLLIDLDRQ